MGYSGRPEWTAYQLRIDTVGRIERPSLLHNTVSWLDSFASVLSADGYSHSRRSISVRYGARMMGSWFATCFSTRPGRNGWPCKTQMEIWKRFSRERLRDTPVQVRSIRKGRVRQEKGIANPPPLVMVAKEPGSQKLREADGPSGESQLCPAPSQASTLTIGGRARVNCQQRLR
jgi:hypothetical protein